MRRCLFLILSLAAFNFSAFSQETLDWTEYMKLIQRADTLYINGFYNESSKAYSNAFAFNNQHFSEGDRYNASRAWARTGQVDSSIRNLELEVSTGFHDFSKLENEPAFQLLKKHPQWEALIQRVRQNEKREDKRLGKLKPVKKKLEEILVLDQQYRKQYMAKLDTLSPSSPEMKTLLQKMETADKNNLGYVTKTLDRYGWLDHRIVGFDAGSALFLVIQHADSATQEKYLPLLRQAVKEKKAFGHDLALLEDRVLVKRGEKQIYGSQVQCDSNYKNCWIFPIEDEKNVDKRRAVIGLPPLAEYVKHWNIVYKLPE